MFDGAYQNALALYERVAHCTQAGLATQTTTLRPQLYAAVIELDDRSHQRADRQERDAFVDQVFAAAGLPVHRVRVQRSYAPAEVCTLLGELAAGEEAREDPPEEPTDDPPAPVAVVLPAPQPAGAAVAAVRTLSATPDMLQSIAKRQ